MNGDDRGRVPFALIGVLLVVSSATVASTMGPSGATVDPAVESALDRATATTTAELRAAVADAAAEAASEPLVATANTSWGAVLSDESPFRDALRVRVYVETQDRLAALERRRGDVRVTAALPPVTNVSALERALARVSVERADDNGTAVRATVANVTLSVRRNGRTVATRSISPSVTVPTPVLAMHDRVAEYERRLNAGIAKPGLTQRLTAGLSGVAWARGWVQYGGGPIENVLANRHVELATNAAALDLQRTTIGHVDRDGLRTVGGAALGVAGQDVLAATDADPPVAHVGDRVATELRRPGTASIEVFDPPAATRAEGETVVGVNRTADDGFLAYTDGGLNETIEDAYTAQVRVETTTLDRRGGPPGPPRSPGPGWEPAGGRSTARTHAAPASGSPPGGGDDWERIEGYVREVRIDHTRERTWVRGNDTRTTSTARTERVTVGIALLRRYGDDGGILDRPVRGLYERGAGPLSGPNLAGIEDRARERLLAKRGGADRLAIRAARGTVDETAINLTGERPEGLREWILADLNGFRKGVRNESQRFERAAVASFDVNPPEELATRLESDRRSRIDPPPTFDGVADRARVAARAAYHDRVHGRLRDRAERQDRRAETLGSHLEGVGSVDALARHARVDARRGPRRVPTLSGPDGPVRLRVDAAPSYLSLAEIDQTRVPAAEGTEHPLVARNVNVFTVPHGDVNESTGDPTFDADDKSRLETAARVLSAANDTLARSANATLVERRDALAHELARVSTTLRERLVMVLVEEGVAPPAEAREIVREGLSRWNSTHGRALALANGSAATPVADAALGAPDVPAHEADRLRLRLDRTLRRAAASDDGSPRARPVEATMDVTRGVAGEVFDRAVAELEAAAIARLEDFAPVPAGLPLAPIPGSWYATTNVWTVTVRGEYARFGVRSTRAGPTLPGAELAYVRDGANVTIDVDGDGEGERFGRASRVDFAVEAATAVLVPPGPQGVGDVDGQRNETSAGWPAAGPK